MKGSSACEVPAWRAFVVGLGGLYLPAVLGALRGVPDVFLVPPRAPPPRGRSPAPAPVDKSPPPVLPSVEPGDGPFGVRTCPPAPPPCLKILQSEPNTEPGLPPLGGIT